MEQAEGTRMAKSRALLTETEREQIAGEHGKERRYQATSRVRARIEDKLSKDVEILKEHHPELFKELRQVVCGASDDLLWEALTYDVTELPEEYQDMSRDEIRDLPLDDVPEEDGEQIWKWMMETREAAKKYNKLLERKDERE